MSDTDWVAHGSHNISVAFDHLVLRVPKPAARRVERRAFDEFELLRTVRRHPQIADVTPKPLHRNPDTGATMSTRIDGEILDVVAPKWTPLPDGAQRALTATLASLASLPPNTLDEVPMIDPGAPRQDYAGNRAALLDLSERIGTAGSEAFQLLGLPDTAIIAARTDIQVRPRPLCVVHGDLHRKNLRTQTSDGRTWILDWELGGIGDPVADLAVALWKMKLPDVDQQTFIDAWEALLPPASTSGWTDDLDALLNLERTKTAVVQVLRAADRPLDEMDAAIDALLVNRADVAHLYGEAPAVGRRQLRDALLLLRDRDI